MESHHTPIPFPLSAELKWEAPVSFSPTAKLQRGVMGGSESTWGHQYLTSHAEELQRKQPIVRGSLAGLTRGFHTFCGFFVVDP